jgi:CBS domain-containing protein
MDILKTAEDLLNEKGSQIHAIGPDVSLADAIAFMNDNNVGAVLIRDGTEYVGIWTERDLLRAVADKEFHIHSSKVRDHMQTKLICARHDEPLFSLIDKVLGLRIRHLLVKRRDQFIGMLSAGDLLRAALQQRTEELHRLQDIVKLEYYDEWRWEKKRKKK